MSVPTPAPVPRPLRRGRATQLRVKRIFDVVVAALCLVVLSPLLAAISITILVRMGRPILFRHRRVGLHGREFTLLKFRTMNSVRDGSGNLLPDADRITGIGSFLRKSTLDEIPELLNVLKGEMSIIGPRPLLPDYVDLYTPDQWRRHDVPPGMAGPVPAYGRNALGWEEKFKLDTWYVDSWSLWLDLRIFLLSVWKVLKREGISAEGHATMPRFEGDPLGKHEE